jgi:hypothetical protein
MLGVGVGVNVLVGVTVGVVVLVGVGVTPNVDVGVGVTLTQEFQYPLVVNHVDASLPFVKL